MKQKKRERVVCIDEPQVITIKRRGIVVLRIATELNQYNETRVLIAMPSDGKTAYDWGNRASAVIASRLEQSNASNPAD
jgi:ABC-type antimicrobial peptide transport system ATPase subunit